MNTTLDRETFLASLDEILELPAGTLKGSERLDGMEHWDSLAVMSFVALVDEKYGVVLSPRQIVTCETVDDLLSAIAAIE